MDRFHQSRSDLPTPTPVAHALRFARAFYYDVAGQQAFFRERNIDRAMSHVDRARQDLEHLQRTGEQWAREKATARLAALPTRDDYAERRRAIDKASTQ